MSLLLCSTHHSLVDQKENEFTVATLKTMKKNHELQNAKVLSNSPQNKFETKLQEIFSSCFFDEIFLTQNFEAPFQDWYPEKMEEGYLSIRKLLNDKCASHIFGELRKELYSLTNLIEDVGNVVTMNTSPNGNGSATPRCNCEYLNIMGIRMKALQEIYLKYRFTSKKLYMQKEVEYYGKAI